MRPRFGWRACQSRAVRLPSLLPLAVVRGLLLSSCGGGDEPAQNPASSSLSSEQGESSPSPSASPSAGSSALTLVPFDGDGFSASMPTAPQRATQDVSTPAGPVTVVLYLSEAGTSAYIVSYAELPSGQGDLPSAIAGAAQNVGGTVRAEKETTYAGFPAREARITGAQGGRATVFTRAIIAKGRLYQLQYAEEGGDVAAPPAVYGQFLASLTID